MVDEAIVYVDRSAIRPGKGDALIAALTDLAAFIDENEPQIVAYQVHINAARSTISVVHIHRDAASLDRHMTVAGPQFPKFADLVDLQSIDVYGTPSDAAIAALRRKAEMLGDARVSIHPRAVGFARLAEGILVSPGST